jgi:hypothetical protein
MSRTAFGIARLASVAGPLGLAVALGAGSLPAFAQSMTSGTGSGACSSIDFQLANPSPGSRVEAGNNIISGVAMDTNAPAGSSGIDRVDFFLGNRDEGGMTLGSAVPGMAPETMGPGSFEIALNFPNTELGGHDLWAYAHDAMTGQESVISETISIGEDTTKAFVTPPSETQSQMCIGGNNASAMTMPASTAPSASTSTSQTSMPATSTTAPSTTTMAPAPMAQSIVLDVGNPSPGDTVHVGAYVLMGQAWDKGAQSGSGIDRVSIFLDNRDQGGMTLGDAVLGNNNMWAAQVTIPSNQTGLHTLWFYAHSSVTGQELAVSVPVTVAP